MSNLPPATVLVFPPGLSRLELFTAAVRAGCDAARDAIRADLAIYATDSDPVVDVTRVVADLRGRAKVVRDVAESLQLLRAGWTEDASRINMSDLHPDDLRTVLRTLMSAVVKWSVRLHSDKLMFSHLSAPRVDFEKWLRASSVLEANIRFIMPPLVLSTAPADTSRIPTPFPATGTLPSDLVPLDAVPNIGDKIVWCDPHGSGAIDGVVISMAECRRLRPQMFKQGEPLKDHYDTTETRRAWAYTSEEGKLVGTYCHHSVNGPRFNAYMYRRA